MVTGLLEFIRSNDHDDVMMRQLLQEFLNQLMKRSQPPDPEEHLKTS